MSKTLKNFDRCKIGYYINYLTADNRQPFQIVGTLAENVTETPNASYINDDWFKYITTLSKNPRPIIDGNTLATAVNEVSIIDDFIIKNYSERYVFSGDLCSWCDYNYKPLDALTISAPLIFQKIMRSKVRALFENKREEYSRLWEIQTAEYNPLNDFDYTEVEKHTGTDTTAHTGTDTTSHSGTDTTTHSGKDTTQNSGTDTTTRTGSQANAHTGTDTDTDSGTDTNTGFTYAFDSVSEVNKDKNTTTHGKQTQTTYNDTLTTSFNNVADATSHGLKSELTHGEQIAKLHGESIATVHGESVGLTHGEKIETTISGSNKSPIELMNEHHEFWKKFNFLEIIAGDIAREISV